MIASAATWGPFAEAKEFADDEHWKRQYGWDKDAETPLGVFDCPRCKSGARQECEICHGSRSFELKRWPTRIVRPDVWGAIECVQLIELGILPAAGGWLDQSQEFIAAARIISREKNQYEKAEIEKLNKR